MRKCAKLIVSTMLAWRRVNRKIMLLPKLWEQLRVVLFLSFDMKHVNYKWIRRRQKYETGVAV
jgi:hypothetical protein